MKTIVEVEWFDAQSGFSCPVSIEEIIAEKPLITFSAGYLLFEDKDKIILGFMLFGEENMVKHWQIIPKGMIKKMKRLR